MIQKYEIAFGNRVELGNVMVVGTSLALVEGGNQTEINLERAAVASARRHEVAIVTREKAPELLAALNDAKVDFNSACAFFMAAYRRTSLELQRRRAQLLIEKIDPEIKQRGLTNVKETREAILAMDPEVRVLEDTAEGCHTAAEFLKVQRDGVRDAWSAVKALFGDQRTGMFPGYRGAPGGDDGRTLDGDANQGGSSSGFGKTNYGRGQ